MRISSQSNAFIFCYPSDFLDSRLTAKYRRLMDKNFIPYESPVEYLSSTIKEVVIAGLSFPTVQQNLRRGKVVDWKSSKSVFDNFARELDIIMRSVDSHLNYFMMMEILLEYYLNNDKPYIPYFAIQVLDKDGTLIYTVLFKEILLKTVSEQRLTYNSQDFNEKTFTLTYAYNFIDIRWELDDDRADTSASVFDLPIPVVSGREGPLGVESETGHALDVRGGPPDPYPDEIELTSFMARQADIDRTQTVRPKPQA